MLTSAGELFGYSIRAQDGEIGSVHDVLFDGASWAVRYVVVSTGVWLFGKKVLIAPASIRLPDHDDKALPVDLTKEQIKDSPDISVDLPLSRDQEIEYHDYYRWPYYWGGAEQPSVAYGVPVAPAAMLLGDTNVEPDSQIPADKRDPHLRSVRDVLGLDLEHDGARLGKAEDIGIDLTGPRIALFVVKLEDERGDRRVVLPNEMIEIGPSDEALTVRLDPSELNAAPAFDAGARLDDSVLDSSRRHFLTSKRS
jgi:hypothetical protein